MTAGQTPSTEEDHVIWLKAPEHCFVHCRPSITLFSRRMKGSQRESKKRRKKRTKRGGKGSMCFRVEEKINEEA